MSEVHTFSPEIDDYAQRYLQLLQEVAGQFRKAVIYDGHQAMPRLYRHFLLDSDEAGDPIARFRLAEGSEEGPSDYSWLRPTEKQTLTFTVPIKDFDAYEPVTKLEEPTLDNSFVIVYNSATEPMWEEVVTYESFLASGNESTAAPLLDLRLMPKLATFVIAPLRQVGPSLYPDPSEE